MNLIGTKVKHRVYGAGTVIAQEKTYVTIEFAAKTSKFVYPGSFEKVIKCDYANVQDAIDEIIAAANAEAELKRQKEEAARNASEEERLGREKEVGGKNKPNNIDALFSADYHAKYLTVSCKMK